MEKLGQKDHDAVVLRFFEDRNFKEVGAALGASEDAAKMRVNRALEKLRKFFTKRGVSSTTAIIAGEISANSVQAAPVALAKSVTAVAVAKGAAVSGSTLTLVKGAMKMMTWIKIKFALGFCVVALLVGGAATIALSGRVANPEAVKILKSVEAKYASLSSYSDTGIIIGGDGQNTVTQQFSINLSRQGIYRAEWNGNAGKFAVWSDGSGDFLDERERNKSCLC